MIRLHHTFALVFATLAAACAAEPASPSNDTDPGASEPGTAIDPEAPDEIMFQSALTAYDGGRFAEAGTQFDELVASHPESPRHDNAGYLAGRCRYELADFAGAVARLGAMRDAHPTSPLGGSAAYFSGRSRFRIGDFAGAAADFASSVSIDADGPFVDNAAYFVGRTEFELRRHADAIATLAAFDSTYPASSYLDNGRYYRGRAHFALGEHATAIDVFATVFDVAGSSYADDAQFMIGRAHYAMSMLDVALADFEAVRTEHPTSVYGDNAMYYQIRIHVDRLDCDAATTALQELSAGYPASTQISRAQTYMTGGGC